MPKSWIIFLVVIGAGAVGYFFYRSQKKAKPLESLLQRLELTKPTEPTTPIWLETLETVFSPAPTVVETVGVAPTPATSWIVAPPLRMPSPPLVAPKLTPEEKGLAEELGISEYTVRKFKQVI